MGFIEKRREKKKTINKMIEEGRLEDILRKFGRGEYYRAWKRVKFNTIKTEKGLPYAILQEIKAGLVSGLKTLGIFALTKASLKSFDYVTHREAIEAYNEKIEEYAEEVRSNNYSDIQIIMKVIDDMWHSIQGYRTPNREAISYPELNLVTEEGYGVCRNMACDVAKKLNKINPEYNARVIIVSLNDDSDLEKADIQRKFLPEDDNGFELLRANDNEKPTMVERIRNSLGNHVIVLVDIKKDDIILAIDPTNPSLGIYQDGKIKMYNDINNEDWDTKKFFTFLVFIYNPRSFGEVPSDYIRSFEKPKLSEKELENKYGVIAQNEALAQIMIKETVDKHPFSERYKVDLSSLEDDTKSRNQHIVDSQKEIKK